MLLLTESIRQSCLTSILETAILMSEARKAALVAEGGELVGTFGFKDMFLTLPVCESNGSVAGLVDVMDLIYGCGGVVGWRISFL